MEDFESDGVKRLNAIDVVRSNPRIYWGVDKPSMKVIDVAVISQLEQEGCKSLAVVDIMGWHCISSETNWFSMMDKSVVELFSDAHWRAGGGGNGFRFEFFLKAIASSVYLYENDQLQKIKGDIEHAVGENVIQHFSGKTCVIYRLAC